jgi:hypothetical protein
MKRRLSEDCPEDPRPEDKQSADEPELEQVYTDMLLDMLPRVLVGLVQGYLFQSIHCTLSVPMKIQVDDIYIHSESEIWLMHFPTASFLPVWLLDRDGVTCALTRTPFAIIPQDDPSRLCYWSDARGPLHSNVNRHISYEVVTGSKHLYNGSLQVEWDNKRHGLIVSRFTPRKSIQLVTLCNIPYEMKAVMCDAEHDHRGIVVVDVKQEIQVMSWSEAGTNVTQTHRQTRDQGPGNLFNKKTLSWNRRMWVSLREQWNPATNAQEWHLQVVYFG